MPRCLRIALAFAAIAIAGCSADGLYSGGQAWQRSNCDRMLDADERARCLASAAKSREEYERQRREAERKR